MVTASATLAPWPHKRATTRLIAIAGAWVQVARLWPLEGDFAHMRGYEMKTPQITPPWSTGIYIGNGVIAEPKPKKIRLECGECGDDLISIDASLYWDVDTQQWEVGDIRTNEMYCTQCGSENINEIEIE